MAVMTNSTVIIVPLMDVVKANNFAWAMGWQPDPTTVHSQSFSVALSADGQEPATHYGTHTWGNDELTQIFIDGKAGIIPDKDWAAYNLNAATVEALFQVFIVSAVDGVDSQANWEATLASNNLIRIAPKAPVNTVSPSLTFTTASPGKAVSCVKGTWVSDPEPTYKYQWQADSVDINQAITSTHTVTLLDVGKVLTCVVTATNFNGSTSAVSNECNAIAKVGKRRRR